MAPAVRPLRKNNLTRAIARVAMWLIIGAVINLAVAWNFMVWHANVAMPVSRDPVDARVDLPRALSWPLRLPSSSWFPPSVQSMADYRGRTVIEMDGGPRRHRFVALALAGWPVRAFRGVAFGGYEASNFIGGTSGVIALDISGGVNLSRPFTSAVMNPGSRVAVLPYVPLWPGFAINTLFYAAITWLLRRIPTLARRARRRRRGWCLGCGYNRTGLAPGAACPECGHVPSPDASVASA